MPSTGSPFAGLAVDLSLATAAMHLGKRLIANEWKQLLGQYRAISPSLRQIPLLAASQPCNIFIHESHERVFPSIHHYLVTLLRLPSSAFDTLSCFTTLQDPAHTSRSQYLRRHGTR